MKVSLQLIPEQPAEELLAAAQTADELGFFACYSADEIYHKDAWLLFAAIAARTDTIRLGPCASPVYMRDPTYVAQLAATLDELSGGRAEVVLGIGNLAMLDQYGIEWRGTRPMARLREAHRVMRALLDEGSIDFRGDFFSYAGVTTAARPVQEHVPVKIGAMGGPRSMELAGEIADGLHTAVARRAGRILAAFYIPSMPPGLLERHGVDAEEIAPVNAAFAAGNIERALDATPDAVVDRIMVAGTPEDWVAWLTNTYMPPGLNHALVSFTDPFTLRAWANREVAGLPGLVEQVRLFGEHVLPRLGPDP
jgi:5,10-methylenetetrahydromethanopterin reductase